MDANPCREVGNRIVAQKAASSCILGLPCFCHMNQRRQPTPMFPCSYRHTNTYSIKGCRTTCYFVLSPSAIKSVSSPIDCVAILQVIHPFRSLNVAFIIIIIESIQFLASAYFFLFLSTFLSIINFSK